jgi:hypothetical protein
LAACGIPNCWSPRGWLPCDRPVAFQLLITRGWLPWCRPGIPNCWLTPRPWHSKLLIARGWLPHWPPCGIQTADRLGGHTAALIHWGGGFRLEEVHAGPSCAKAGTTVTSANTSAAPRCSF